MEVKAGALDGSAAGQQSAGVLILFFSDSINQPSVNQLVSVGLDQREKELQPRSSWVSRPIMPLKVR